MILSGIMDDIYSTVDACTTTKEMWTSIKRLQHGESLNKQDVKTNLCLEFGKFTSRDEDSTESYYSRFYKMMNEMVRNQLEVSTMKPKRVKDFAHYKEKMMLCKHEDKGVPLSVDKGDWLDDTDEEPDEHELEAHYMYMEKIQEVFTTESRPKFDAEPLEKVQFDDHYNVFANERQYSKQPKSINDTYVVEKVDSNVISYSSNMCDNDGKDDQNAKEYKDKRDVLANLILNLKLDTDENKKIQKQLKKENASLTNELKECKSTLIKSNDVRDRGRSALHHKE
nr:hypothetical protein [Tanacetum cinerariifolium]